jgi:hypothetical protein
MTPEQRAGMIQAMIATSAQLSRLLLRMHKLEHSARYHPDGMVDRNPHWTIGDIDPPWPVIEGMDPGKALAAGITSVLDVQSRLLSACASDDDIDPLWACRVLQALGDDYAQDFSPLVRRMAEMTGAELPSSPRELHHGLGLREFPSPGEWRPPPPYIAGQNYKTNR